MRPKHGSQGARDRHVRVRLARALVVLCSLPMVFAAPAAQRLEFAAPVSHPLTPLETIDRAVEVVDLNEDRRQDIAVVTASLNGTDSEIAVYLQTQAGTLAPPQRFSFPATGGSVATVVLGETGEVEHASRTLVVGYLAGIAYLDYDRTNGAFSVKQFPVNGCQCDKLTSWFDGLFTFYLAAPTITAGELMLIRWDAYFSSVVQRVHTGLAGSVITDLAARKVTPGGLAMSAEQLGAIYWVPIGPGEALGAPRPYTGLAPGETPRALEVGNFFEGRDEVAVSVASGDYEARIVFLYPENGELVERTALPSAYPATSLRAANLDGQAFSWNEDLLVGHGDAGSIGFYLGDPVAPALREPERFAVTGSNLYSEPDGVASGDVNGDGIGDVVFVGDGAMHIAYGRLQPLRDVRDDFDGNGRSDLFWQHADARRVIWRGADYRDQLAVPSGTDPAWVPAALADFDGNGYDDLLLYREGYGTLVFWPYGPGGSRPRTPPAIKLDWRVVASGDFDGDGADDLVWRNGRTGQNVMWKRGDYYDQRSMTAVTDTGWKIVGAGDFDGDGRDDLVWRHDLTGKNAIWNSGDYRTQTAMTAVTNATWRVAEVADFDGDGRGDIFWRAGSGTNTIWLSANAATRLAVDAQPAQWLLGAVGDYDGDGNDDVVWRHRTTGANTLWPAADASAARAITSVTDQAWRLY